MSNPAKPEYKISLGGKERILRLDLNAMVTFEAVTSKPFIRLDFKRMTDVRAFLYAALKADSPELTLDDVGGMITPQSIPELTVQMEEAVRESLPEPGKGTGGQKNLKKSTG